MTDPPWIGELLARWAARDWDDARDDLGFPGTAGFARALASSQEEDAGGYSSAELRAIAAAIEWLQLAHPGHWRVVCRAYRPWTRDGLHAQAGDADLLVEAVRLLANYIDNVLG